MYRRARPQRRDAHERDRPRIARSQWTVATNGHGAMWSAAHVVVATNVPSLYRLASASASWMSSLATCRASSSCPFN